VYTVALLWSGSEYSGDLDILAVGINNNNNDNNMQRVPKNLNTF
jgi:hypothetical protein